jgi:hypothetical protein
MTPRQARIRRGISDTVAVLACVGCLAVIALVGNGFENTLAALMFGIGAALTTGLVTREVHRYSARLLGVSRPI